MEKNIVERIVRGSENIDRMKKEVEQVVRTILGLALVLVSSPPGVDARFGATECWWEVEIWNDRIAQRSAMRARCWRRIGMSSSLAYSTINTELANVRMEDVQMVHESLNVFVEGMLRIIPQLDKCVQPLLEATDKFTD